MLARTSVTLPGVQWSRSARGPFRGARPRAPTAIKREAMTQPRASAQLHSCIAHPPAVRTAGLGRDRRWPSKRAIWCALSSSVRVLHATDSSIAQLLAVSTVRQQRPRVSGNERWRAVPGPGQSGEGRAGLAQPVQRRLGRVGSALVPAGVGGPRGLPPAGKEVYPWRPPSGRRAAALWQPKD